MNRTALKAEARIINRTTAPSPFAITLVFLVITMALNYFVSRTGVGFISVDPSLLYSGDFQQAFDITAEDISLFGVIVYACIELVTIILHYGYSSYTLRVSRRQSAGIPNLMDGFVQFGKVLLLNILVSIFVFLWSLLLIVPGIIAGYKYCMAIYVLMDHPDWSVMACIRESKRIMQGHKWEFFVLMLSFIGWILLSVIPGVSIYTNPYMYVTQALFYNRLIGYEAVSEEKNDSPEEEKKPWEY